MNVKLVSWTKNPIDTIAMAASVCYDSKPSEQIVRGCVFSSHLSVLEHCNFTFKIEGVSRALLAQLTRHRVGVAFSVRSQRYCSEDAAEMIIPKSNNEDIYKEAYDDIKNVYSKLQSLGEKNEDARMVLPNACPTTIILTVNLRELMHICNERLCTRAQEEIRTMTKRMRDEVLSCSDISDEFRRFMANYMLVPKCRKTKLHVCTEHNTCGAAPTINEINQVIKNHFY